MVVDPVLELGQIFGRKADLFVLAAGIADREHGDGMSPAAGALEAAFAMADESMQQRTANGLGEIGHLRDELGAFPR